MRLLESYLRGYEPYQVILEMAVIWVCIYIAFRSLRGTRGSAIIKALAVIVVLLTLVIQALDQVSDAFARLKFLYNGLLAALALVLIVVFQPELRQAMTRLGRRRWFRGSASAMAEVADAVSNAADFLSKNQFGAIIAIERTIQLGGLLESGVRLDAEVGSELLKNIFWPNSPLHDLGVIIRGKRILAAGVQFPLAEEGTIPRHYGSRHRAAIGVTLESDCVAVIVSEETGAVSIAEGGRLMFDIPRDQFRDRLARLLRVEASRDEEEEAGASEEAGDVEPIDVGAGEPAARAEHADSAPAMAKEA